MKSFVLPLICIAIFTLTKISLAQGDSYAVEIEQMSMPGTPAIHSFAFAQSNGKWLFIGGRTNGLHGFTPINAFPKQFSNKNIFVVDPVAMQTWSRNIFVDFPFTVSDQLRSTNMEYTQVGNKLYIVGGYGYDSLTNFLVTFPTLTVIDVEETIQAIISGAPINNYLRQVTDNRMKITGGELHKLGDYFYLVGGHTFNGTYRRTVNDQVYSDQIRKFKVDDDGVGISISDYSSDTDPQYHRRDMNVVPCIKSDGTGEYITLYGGVFKPGIDLPFLNPIYIYNNSANTDFGFEQKLNQYTCAYLSVFNGSAGSMHTTFFGGMSLYFYNENTQELEVDSLVPFTDDISTITKNHDGTSVEKVLDLKMPGLLGTNAKFILNPAISHFDNGVIKLNEISGRTLAGYIYGGIRGLLPNNGLSYPSEYILKVFITPDTPLPVEMTSFTSSVVNRNVNLFWTTSFEENNFGFEIHRTTSGDEWDIIGFVKGYGNTTINKSYSFTDNNLSSGTYNYRLKQIDINGNYNYHELTNEVIIGIPEKFSISQNYPNPFNPATIISYQIPFSASVTLTIFDINGREIAKLVNEKQNAGYYNVNFNPVNLSSGIYYYKLQAGSFVETKRMLLLK